MADLLGRKLTPIQAAVVAAVNRPGGEDEGNICFHIKRPLHVTRRVINRLTSAMTGPTMADARETARVKTHDDCLCEGADTATLVSRIEAHVLAYAAGRCDQIASMDDAAMEKMQAMMGQVAEQRDTALAYAAERERLLAETDEVITRIWFHSRDADPEQHDFDGRTLDRITNAYKRHAARQSSPAQDEGKPTT